METQTFQFFFGRAGAAQPGEHRQNLERTYDGCPSSLL